jgi:hypothetical protein
LDLLLLAEAVVLAALVAVLVAALRERGARPRE